MSNLAVEMRRAIAAIAGPRGFGETRERWLERAARRAQISYRQARSLFYLETRDPRGSVVEAVRRAHEKAVRSEATGLANKLEVMARGMHAADQEFFDADIAALCRAARALRSVAGAENPES